MKDADFRESSLPASEVFAQRLGETRRARNLTQTKLAQQLAATGDPISQPTLSRIESGEQPVYLDQALALTYVLRAVPAHMLAPPDGKLIRLSAGLATDASSLRQWLVSGLPHRTDPSDIEDDVASARYHERLHQLALAFVDAARLHGDDGKDALNEAAQALTDEVIRELRRRGGETR